MFKNYLVMAFRQMAKNKLYVSINTVGLVVGLAIYLFGTVLVDYERSHDLFFANADRIYTAGSLFSSTANIGVSETDGMYTAFTPFIDSEIEEVEQIARVVGETFLLSHEDKHFYQYIRFADPALLQILDFQYIEGDERAFDDPSGVILNEATALKYFGNESALGQTLTLDHGVSLRVSAVIKALPANTHFNSSLFAQGGVEVIAPLQALNRAIDYDLAGNFNNLSNGDITYMLLAPSKDQAWLQRSLDGVYDRHFPEESRDFITGLNVRPLVEANTMIWDSAGLPVLDSIRLLGLLVLIVAIVNYTNLATAQSLGRSREIGLRKTMGASRGQLIAQFLVESLCIAFIAMIIALGLIEIVIPAFNTALDKGLVLNYVALAPWIALTTLAVGIIAGTYPALLITRATPIDALRDGGKRSSKGGAFRSAMLVLQFSISIFMLAMVMVMYLQNQKIEDASDIYPKSQIIVLNRLHVDEIQERLETLRNELNTIPGVERVSYSSQMPFEGSNSSFTATPEMGDEDQSMLLTQIIVDDQFLQNYDIPLLAGRHLDRNIAGDTLVTDVTSANVILNELAVRQLGLGSPHEAIGRVFYDIASTREARAYTVVGVTPDQNFQGFHNRIKPTTFFILPSAFNYGSIKVTGAEMATTLTAVEAAWDKLIPDYPIQTTFLEDDFRDSFNIYTSLSNVFGMFAFIAMSLSLIGLFGLAAFMAEIRTKEIGVRKVMGASTLQIVRLLIWQFSKPVLWALLIALPTAYLASGVFLQFFAERITLTEAIVAGAGVLGVLFAWLIVGIHAYRIARSNPIMALRHE